jgi:hypothetical protein
LSCCGKIAAFLHVEIVTHPTARLVLLVQAKQLYGHFSFSHRLAFGPFSATLPFGLSFFLMGIGFGPSSARLVSAFV